MGKKAFRLVFDEDKYNDVIEALTACPKPLRHEYVAEAIRFLRKNFLVNQNQENKQSKKETVIDFKNVFK